MTAAQARVAIEQAKDALAAAEKKFAATQAEYEAAVEATDEANNILNTFASPNSREIWEKYIQAHIARAEPELAKLRVATQEASAVLAQAGKGVKNAQDRVSRAELAYEDAAYSVDLAQQSVKATSERAQQARHAVATAKESRAKLADAIKRTNAPQARYEAAKRAYAEAFRAQRRPAFWRLRQQSSYNAFIVYAMPYAF